MWEATERCNLFRVSPLKFFRLQVHTLHGVLFGGVAVFRISVNPDEYRGECAFSQHVIAVKLSATLVAKHIKSGPAEFDYTSTAPGTYAAKAGDATQQPPEALE